MIHKTLGDVRSVRQSKVASCPLPYASLCQVRIDNGIRGQPIRDGHNKVYKSMKSFSDLIQGKEGRFRETLLE